MFDNLCSYVYIYVVIFIVKNIYLYTCRSIPNIWMFWNSYQSLRDASYSEYHGLMTREIMYVIVNIYIQCGYEKYAYLY